MKHTLSVLVENKPGVLTRVAGLFARRGFNIESLAVGQSEDPALSRITITIDGAEHPIDQVTKQLHKLINVVKIRDLEPATLVAAELLLVKVSSEGEKRTEVLQIAEIFNAKIVDVDRRTLTLRVVGASDKLEALLELLQPLGILEIVRTGTIAIGRGRGYRRGAARGVPMAALFTRPELQVSDPGVVIRRAGVRDLPLVYAFELAYIKEIEPAAEAAWHDALQRQLEHWITCLPHMFVAERHGEAVGECFWQTGEGGALLASLCVAPAARRRGVGRLLLEAFERDAAAAGFSCLALGVYRATRLALLRRRRLRGDPLRRRLRALSEDCPGRRLVRRPRARIRITLASTAFTTAATAAAALNAGAVGAGPWAVML